MQSCRRAAPSPVSPSAWAKWPPRSASVWTSTCWPWTGFLIPAAAGWWKPSWASDISQANLPAWLSGGAGTYVDKTAAERLYVPIRTSCLVMLCRSHTIKAGSAHCLDSICWPVPVFQPVQYIPVYLRCLRILLWKGNKLLYRTITLMKALLIKQDFSFRCFICDKCCF